ncbi:TPA: hypothetical protein ACFOA4_001348, partial [Neisseria meningitidis]
IFIFHFAVSRLGGRQKNFAFPSKIHYIHDNILQAPEAVSEAMLATHSNPETAYSDTHHCRFPLLLRFRRL